MERFAGLKSAQIAKIAMDQGELDAFTKALGRFKHLLAQANSHVNELHADMVNKNYDSSGFLWRDVKTLVKEACKDFERLEKLWK